jgi:hypothetical protein
MVTTLEKLLKANRWRIRNGKMASDETYGFNGAFLVPIDGAMWHVIISDGMGWKHLSITNAERKVLPSWNVMCRAKDLFFADDEWTVQFMPAKDDNINDHPFCLHIWMPLNEEMPRPSVVQV